MEKCLSFTLFINSDKLFVPVRVNLNIYVLKYSSARYPHVIPASVRSLRSAVRPNTGPIMGSDLI